MSSPPKQTITSQGLGFEGDVESTDGVDVSHEVFTESQLREAIQAAGMTVDEARIEALGGSDLQLAKWDFAGQTVYYLTHEFFLSPRPVYILLWKCSPEHPIDDAQLEFWLSNIQHHGPEANVFLIGTHADVLTEDQRHFIEAEEEWERLERLFSQHAKEPVGKMKLSLHLVDSKSNRGIAELRGKLLAATLNTTGFTVPKQWLAMQDRVIEEHSAPDTPWQLDLKEFKETLGKGIPRIEDALEQLWHPMGESLRYCKSRSETLRDMVIVRPPTLSDVFKCVFTQHNTTQLIKQANGRASHNLLSIAFRPHTGGDTRVLDQLVDLMVEFHLAYRDPENKTKLVLPFLMQEEPPTEFRSLPPDAANVSRLIFTMPFTPSGFASRVLCAIQNGFSGELAAHFIRHQWCDGAVLELWNATSVRIWLAHNELKLTVWGNDISSRDKTLTAVKECTAVLMEESLTEMNRVLQIFVPCPRCVDDETMIEEEAGKFQLSKCEELRKGGMRQVRCCHGHEVLLCELLGNTQAMRPNPSLLLTPPTGKPLRILSLDGGGIRGLIPAIILKEIVTRTGKPLHELFDIICGTSTGGLIALGLGVAHNRVNIDKVIEVYEKRAGEIFPSIPVLGGQVSRVLFKGAQYNPKGVERIAKELLGEDTMLNSPKDAGTPHVFVVSCDATLKPPSSHLFCNYPRENSTQDGSNACHAWEAARATSAAPVYFDPIRINGRLFKDGGLVANNPTQLAVMEASRLFPDRSIDCIVSLGTGKNTAVLGATSVAGNIGEIISAATDSEKVHAAMPDVINNSRNCDEKTRYFRLNPEGGIGDIDLAATAEDEMIRMRAVTEAYVQEHSGEGKPIDEIMKLLARPRTKQMAGAKSTGLVMCSQAAEVSMTGGTTAPTHMSAASISELPTGQCHELLGADMVAPQDSSHFGIAPALSKQWHLFISHKQQGADGYAAFMKERLGRRGLKCWVDTAERCDRAGMEAGIKGSEAVLVFLFKGTLDRLYCRFEMRLARAYGVPVIVILEADSYRDTYVSIFDVIGHFDSGALPLDLKCVAETADFNLFYRRQEHEVDGMLNRLCEKLHMSQAEGEWPLNRQQKGEVAIKAEVSEAYRLLDVEAERQNAREAEAAEVFTSPQGQLMFTDTDGDTSTLKLVDSRMEWWARGECWGTNLNELQWLDGMIIAPQNSGCRAKLAHPAPGTHQAVKLKADIIKMAQACSNITLTGFEEVFT